MGLMDRVKAQATQLAQKTQEAAAEGKARIDQAQANRRGDTLLRNLGAAVYAERTGRGGPNSQATIDKLIDAVSQHEKENGLNLASEQPDPTAPQQNFPSDAPGGFAGPSAQADPGSGGTSSFPPEA
jgi:hypothetical protein